MHDTTIAAKLLGQLESFWNICVTELNIAGTDSQGDMILGIRKELPLRLLDTASAKY